MPFYFKALRTNIESGKKGVQPRITGANHAQMVADHLSMIREVDVGAAFLSTFTLHYSGIGKRLGVFPSLLFFSFLDYLITNVSRSK